MNNRFAIRLSVMDRYGDQDAHMVVEMDEFPVFSERFVEDVTSEFAPLALGPEPFNAMVKILKTRQFRKDMLERAAQVLARRLSDYIEDREGWHGERRRDTIKEQRRG